ncbi:MAG TPA: phosphotransferase [Chloroflexaceae bacterium]|nr:phosphotransferase [Chloroflexaceae bacterium]
MTPRSLEEIQALQFHDLAVANEALREFFGAYLPFGIESLQIRPLAVSLNSINGFLTADDGRRLFFKTHVESQGVLDEYYNAAVLAEAGYAVIQPIYAVAERDRQVLVYEVVELPSLFDVAHAIERGERGGAEAVVAAQERSDAELFAIYLRTLTEITAEQNARAPVHQLFAHRLTGGRFAQFYQGRPFALPGATLGFAELAGMRWRINGRAFAETLGEIIGRAAELLDPATPTVAVVGHGDAHNGNLFFDEGEGRLIYFDPAFAGTHSPFLDLAKPLFHNVFARWMYFPGEVAAGLTLRCELRGDTIAVEHDFAPSALRVGLLRSKLGLVLGPLVRELGARAMLSPDWRAQLKAALFCCPFLTMNLGDRGRFPPEVGLLGLCMAVELGGTLAGGEAGLFEAELDRALAS